MKSISSIAKPMEPILCLGGINADFLFRVETPRGSDNLLEASEYLRSSGGKAVNRAWLAARFAHPTSLIGMVGDDELANQALAAAVSVGVDTSAV